MKNLIPKRFQPQCGSENDVISYEQAYFTLPVLLTVMHEPNKDQSYVVAAMYRHGDDRPLFNYVVLQKSERSGVKFPLIVAPTNNQHLPLDQWALTHVLEEMGWTTEEIVALYAQAGWRLTKREDGLWMEVEA